jgi:hypothetical protein
MLSNRGPLEVVGFNAPLRGGPLWEQSLENAPRDPDHAVVLADLDPELDGPPLDAPGGVLREGEERDPTHALFADQSHSIQDNVMALLGRL